MTTGNYKRESWMETGKYVRSKESKEKMSKTRKRLMKEGKIESPLKGKHHSEETKRNMSIMKKGKKFTLEHRKNQSNAIKNNLPKTAFKKGQKPWNYIDGRSKLLTPARYGDDWDKIRYLVYLRDKFTCQHCGIKKQRLDVHHKIPFLISFDNSLGNLISLCKPCHRKEEVRIMRELKNQKVEV